MTASRGGPQSKRSSHGVKLAAALLGFCIALVLLEVVLQCLAFFLADPRAGLVYESKRKWERNIERAAGYNKNETYEIHPGKGRKTTILAVGDSFTNAGNVSWRRAYPYLLYKLLGKQSTVRNMGVCEDTTSGFHQRLKYFVGSPYFSKSDDNIAIILTGAADIISDAVPGERYFGGKNGPWTAPQEKLGASGLETWFDRLKLVKVVRFIGTEFELRSLPHTLTLWQKKSMVDSLEVCLRAPSSGRKNDCISSVLEAHRNELGYEHRSSVVDSHFTEIISALRRHYGPNNYRMIFRELLHIVRQYPPALAHEQVRLMLFAYAMRQGELSAKEIHKQISAIVKSDRLLIESPEVSYFVGHLEGRAKGRDRINALRLRIWGEIVALCRENNIKLVIQTYPVNYVDANNMLTAIARRYSLPLVDNLAVFDQLTRLHGVERYIESDDHCTEEGYEIIAQNVYKTLSGMTSPLARPTAHPKSPPRFESPGIRLE